MIKYIFSIVFYAVLGFLIYSGGFHSNEYGMFFYYALYAYIWLILLFQLITALSMFGNLTNAKLLAKGVAFTENQKAMLMKLYVVNYTSFTFSFLIDTLTTIIIMYSGHYILSYVYLISVIFDGISRHLKNKYNSVIGMYLIDKAFENRNGNG